DFVNSSSMDSIPSCSMSAGATSAPSAVPPAGGGVIGWGGLQLERFDAGPEPAQRRPSPDEIPEAGAVESGGDAQPQNDDRRISVKQHVGTSRNDRKMPPSGPGLKYRVSITLIADRYQPPGRLGCHADRLCNR